MSKQKKIQMVLEFSSGILAVIFANLLCYIFFTTVFHKIVYYPSDTWTGYIYVILSSYTVVFLGFFSSLNIAKRSRPMEIFSTVRNCIITYALIAVLLIITKNRLIESRYLFIGSFILYFILSLAFRFIIKKGMLKYFSSSKYATQAGIITSSDRAEDFVANLKTDWSKNIKAVALLDTVFSNNSYYQTENVSESYNIITTGKRIDNICDIPVVANSDNLLGWIRTASLDEVFINLPSDYDEHLNSIIEELEDMGITVNVNINSLESIVEKSKFNNLDCIIKKGYPMAVFSPAVQSDKNLIIKRLLDIVGGIVGSIISLPIILITAIPLLIESPGPLIFKQQRIGRNGRVFNIYKLRSMYVDAEERKAALMAQNKMDGLMFKMDDDPRITKVGKIIRKLSIDELPQFWNVVKGDMSLVGTRPPTIDEFEQYESHHKRRLSLKPGITGLWQVSGRSDIQDFEEVVKLDCEYIDNQSLWLDIKILFKTVGVVLTHKGAE